MLALARLRKRDDLLGDDPGLVVLFGLMDGATTPTGKRGHDPLHPLSSWCRALLPFCGTSMRLRNRAQPRLRPCRQTARRNNAAAGRAKSRRGSVLVEVVTTDHSDGLRNLWSCRSNSFECMRYDRQVRFGLPYPLSMRPSRRRIDQGRVRTVWSRYPSKTPRLGASTSTSRSIP